MPSKTILVRSGSQPISGGALPQRPISVAMGMRRGFLRFLRSPPPRHPRPGHVSRAGGKISFFLSARLLAAEFFFSTR